MPEGHLESLQAADARVVALEGEAEAMRDSVSTLEAANSRIAVLEAEQANQQEILDSADAKVVQLLGSSLVR